MLRKVRITQCGANPPTTGKEVVKIEPSTAYRPATGDPRMTDSDVMPAPSLLPGTEIAGYVLERVIGRGGMGVVWRARQIVLDRPVALKRSRRSSRRTEGSVGVSNTRRASRRSLGIPMSSSCTMLGRSVEFWWWRWIWSPASILRTSSAGRGG